MAEVETKVHCAYCQLNGFGADNCMAHTVGKYGKPYGEFSSEQGGYSCHKHMKHSASCPKTKEKRKQRKHIQYMKDIHKSLTSFEEKKLLRLAKEAKCECTKPINSFWECSGAWRDTNPVHVVKLFLRQVYRMVGESMLEKDNMPTIAQIAEVIKEKALQAVEDAETGSTGNKGGSDERAANEAATDDADVFEVISREGVEELIAKWIFGEEEEDSEELVIDNGKRKWKNVSDLVNSVAKETLHLVKNGLTPLFTAVMYGASVDSVCQLVKLDPSSVIIANKVGWNALHHLTADTPKASVSFILKVYEEEVKRALDMVVKTHEMTPEEFCKRQNISQSEHVPLSYRHVPKPSTLPIIDALRQCSRMTEDEQQDTIRFILKKYGCGAKRVDCKKRLPLHHAAFEGSCGAIESLVSKFPMGVRAKNDKDQTPLDVAVHRKEKGASEILRKINGKEKKVQVDAADRDDRCICRRYYRSPTRNISTVKR
jgi:hypothetical protein|eukprot:g3715.t1